jgi:hypothetical protein
MQTDPIARPTSGLLLDNAGNLYGTTSDSSAGGYGEIFQLAPPTSKGGAWTEPFSIASRDWSAMALIPAAA